MNRRSAITSIGAVTLGISSPIISKGDILNAPYELINQKVETDILVVGGGTAGVIAAIQAGRAGQKVILVENGSMLGGTTTTGGVNFPGIFFAWGKQIISGIGWELVQEVVKLNDDKLPDFSLPHGRQHWKHQVRVNGPLYALLAEQKCLEADVKIRFYESPVEALFSNNKWKVITMGKGVRAEILCDQLIDCTGNAFVANIAGFSLLRESETQPGTLNFRIGGYDLDSIDKELVVRRYNDAVSKGELIKGQFYNVIGLLNNAGDNVQHIANADSTTSISHTVANIAGRSSLLDTLRFLRTLPGLERLRILNMQNETAVRETYRIDGLYKITHDDYVSGRVFEDAVSYSYYPIDLHDEKGVIPKHLEQGMIATIPLRSLIPKNSKNFIVAGRCLSSDRLANSALRVQASCMGMGQAAAAVAVLAKTSKQTPSNVSIKKVWEFLKENGAIIPKA